MVNAWVVFWAFVSKTIGLVNRVVNIADTTLIYVEEVVVNEVSAGRLKNAAGLRDIEAQLALTAP